jgi:hypothetical protein
MPLVGVVSTNPHNTRRREMSEDKIVCECGNDKWYYSDGPIVCGTCGKYKPIDKPMSNEPMERVTGNLWNRLDDASMGAGSAEIPRRARALMQDAVHGIELLESSLAR